MHIVKSDFSEWLLEVLDRYDPMGLLRDGNAARQYRPEAHEILEVVPRMRSADELNDAIFALFVDYFDAESAGTKERYAKLAAEIYNRWNE